MRIRLGPSRTCKPRFADASLPFPLCYDIMHAVGFRSMLTHTFRGSAFLKHWMEFLEENADLRYPNLTDVYDDQ